MGTGTGILARQLAAHGCRVLGIEPDQRMADFARSTGVVVEVATFEGWDDADRVFDAVVAGTAWHWVDPVVGAAKAARVLRPGGVLAPIWHIASPPPAVAAATASAVQRAAGFPAPPPGMSALAGYEPLLARAADGMRVAGGFTEPARWVAEWDHVYSRAQWLDQVPTSGILARLPADQVAEVVAAVDEAIDGDVPVHYLSVAVAATLRT